MKLVLATRNPGKIREITDRLDGLGLEFLTLEDFPEIGDIAETGDTFADNAFIKAQTVANAAGLPALADDSGLCVDALGGGPGVYSARYAGDAATDEDNNAKLMQDMADIPHDKRGAEYRAVVVVAWPNGAGREPLAAEGACRGEILTAPRGTGGFGYDPYFYYPPFGQTFGEVDLARKQTVSHRGRALDRLREELKQCADQG